MKSNRLATGLAVKEGQLLIICCVDLQNRHLLTDCFDFVQFSDVLLILK